MGAEQHKNPSQLLSQAKICHNVLKVPALALRHIQCFAISKHTNNLSWNCGVEGPSDDPAIEQLRSRQVKNFFTITLLALGVPMILMGDEIRRTQQGNNNAYCQDNETNWLDWNLLDRHGDLHRFVKKIIRLLLSLDVFK